MPLRQLFLIGAIGISILIAVPQSFSAVSVSAVDEVVSADVASDSSSPEWTILSPITIEEPADGTGNGDFGAGVNQTLVLHAPAGFEFRTDQAPDVTFDPGGDIILAFVSALDSDSITISLNVVGGLAKDRLSIGATNGIQVRPQTGRPLAASRHIYRPASGGGTIVINGMVADQDGSGGTSFGLLSETVGTASQLAFDVQPGAITAGAAFGVQPIVRTRDQFGNNSTVGLPGNLPLSIALTAGAGLLSGTTSLNIGTNASNGVAAFTDLQIDAPGTNRQLTAMAVGFADVSSSSFTVMANQSINFASLPGRTYGDSPFTLNATASSGLPVNFTVVSGPATLTNSTVTITGAGMVVVRASQSGDDLYHPAEDVDQSFAVSPANLSITPNNVSKIFGAPNPAFTATFTGLVNDDTMANLNGTLTFTTASGMNSPVGSYVINCSGLSSPNYNIHYLAGALIITPAQWGLSEGGNGHFYEPVLATNGITWSNAQSIATLRGGYLVSITSSSENDFVYSLVTNDPSYWAPDGDGHDGPWLGAYKLPGPSSSTNWAWVSGEPFTYQNWGPFQPNNFGGIQDHIQFWGPDSPTGNLWNDAGNNEIQFAHAFIIEYESFLTKTIQTISFAPIPDKDSGDVPFSVSATASSGLPVSFSIVSGPATIAGNIVTITGIGTVVVRASQIGDTNFYAAPDIDVAFHVNRSQWSVLEGGNGHFYEVVSAPGGITWSNAQDRAFHMGGYLATVTSSNENSFIFGIINKNTSFWINDSGELLGPWLGGFRLAGPSSPTNWAWVTGEDFSFQNWGLDQPNNVLNMQDHLQFFSATLAFDDKWNDLGNTEIGYVDSFVVEYDRDPELRTNQIITFDLIPNKTYGDPSFTINASSSSGLPVTLSVDYGPVMISGNLVTIRGVGACTIRASQLGDTNFSRAVDVTRSFLVNPALLTVVANNASRTYGSTNPVFTGSITGLKNDNITVTFVTSASTNSPVGSYPIVPGLSDPDNKLMNYTVQSSNAVLTVTPAALTVVANDASRAYGKPDPVFTGTLTGIQNNDNITASFATTALVDSPPGTYPIIPNLVDPGSLLSNYNVFSTNGTLTITQISQPPVILSLVVNDGSGVVLTWSSVSNSIYRIQASSDANGGWTNLMPDVTALGTSACKTDHVGVVEKRFYRVLLLP